MGLIYIFFIKYLARTLIVWYFCRKTEQKKLSKELVRRGRVEYFLYIFRSKFISYAYICDHISGTNLIRNSLPSVLVQSPTFIWTQYQAYISRRFKFWHAITFSTTIILHLKTLLNKTIFISMIFILEVSYVL